MSARVTSTARVATGRPARYARQLASHLGRTMVAEFDPDIGRGQFVFPTNEAGVPLGTCDMLCGDGVLVLAMEAPEEHIGQAEEIVGSHLVRFGGEDELVVEWVRAT